MQLKKCAHAELAVQLKTNKSISGFAPVRQCKTLWFVKNVAVFVVEVAKCVQRHAAQLKPIAHLVMLIQKMNSRSLNKIHHGRSHLENTQLCPKTLSEKQLNIVNKIVVLRKK